MKLIKVVGAVLSAALFVGQAHAVEQIGTIRIAEADLLGPEDLVPLIAYARATERGVKIVSTNLKSDDIAFQAVLNGQMDVGVGDSYEAISNLNAPLRNIYQIRKLAYIPVVDKTVYPTWKSLDGQEFAVHSRGSGTETMAIIMQKKEGIHFSRLSYVPSSQIRLIAMQRGNMKATYLSLPITKLLIDSDPKRFGALPTDSVDASDSTLYVSTAFLKQNTRALEILMEELMKAARATAADPAWPAAQRKALNLLPDLAEKEVAGITPYYEQANALHIFPTDGGGMRAANADIEFLTTAGKLKTTPPPTPAAFWDFAPLDAAKKTLESQK